MNVRDGIVRAEKDGKLQIVGFQWWETVSERYGLTMGLFGWTGWPLVILLPVFIATGDTFFNRTYYKWGNPLPQQYKWGWFETIAYLYSPIWLLIFGLFFYLVRKYQSTEDLVRCGFVVEPENGILVSERHDWFKRADDWKHRQFSRLRQSYLDINSIEMVPTKNVGGGHYKFRDEYRYSVRLYFKDGNDYTLTSDLVERDARVVQTQLDAAWREACQAVAARKPKPVPDHLLRELAKVPERGRPTTPARGTVTEEDF